MRRRKLVFGFLTAFLLSLSFIASPARAETFATPSEATVPAADEADSLYALAGRLYSEGRFHQAIPVFRRVIELDPRHANAYALLGGAYLQLGDHSSAIQAFERALQIDEGIKLAYLGLVVANYFTDRIEAAREWVVRMVPILNSDEKDRYLAMLSAQFPLLDLGS